MSTHPYRSKVPVSGPASEASKNSSPTSDTFASAGQTVAPYPLSQYPGSAPYPVSDPVHGNTLGSRPLYNQPARDYPNLSADLSDLSISQDGNNFGDSDRNDVTLGSFHAAPLSPARNSLSLSATSSVTNVSNQNNGHASETNLTPVKLDKATHNRSVSSVSSFFPDRSDASVIELSQNIITQHLGDNSSHLLPRIKTIELYRKNAKKSNDPTVLFQYAQYMLQTALIIDQNADLNSSNSSPGNSPVKASPDFKKSHSKASSSLDLSKISSGDNVDEQQFKRSLLKEAQYYLRKLSDKGYADAQYLLADALSSGALGKVDNRESFGLFQSAAKRGHVESAYRTSYCYEEGLGTGRDARKAIDYLKMAASKNHPSAMYKLGIYSFYTRMGLPGDDNTKKMGIKWLKRASDVATELIAAAPFELGKIYFDGFKDILLQDQKYALELYSQAAALGHAESAAILGRYYEVGEIVPQDSNLSIHYYTQGALSGDANSMLAMCAWYLVGNEPYLPKDENEAYEWAKRAAICNLPKAQFALASFYEKGIGCEKNSTTAQYWYSKAAENGDDKALNRVEDKELKAKIQKTLKKKRSKNILRNSNVSNLPDPANKSEKQQAQEKDCIIM